MRRHGIEEPADAVFINPARYKYVYNYLNGLSARSPIVLFAEQN